MDVLWYLAGPVAVLVSCIVGFYAGQYRQQQGDLEIRLRELEDRVWEFAHSASEYWDLDPSDDKLPGLEMAMKHLSARIGSDISHLNSTYGNFDFRDHKRLSALRQTAMGSPFEERGRRSEPRRGDEIRRAATELMRELSVARRRRWTTRIKDRYSRRRSTIRLGLAFL